jgi:tRNA 2-thiocytidine biosynthesis protein TtcA
MDKRDFQAFVSGNMPSWLERLLARMETSMMRFGMLPSDGGIMAGLSGGKDSLCLVLLLALSRRRPEFSFSLEACLVDWTQAPLARGDLESIRAFCDCVGVPLAVIEAPWPQGRDGKDFSCYACARTRKSLVFSHARSRGCRSVAFGHHLDDAMATALVNSLGHGRLEALAPTRSFFSGEVRLIRPMIDLAEASIGNAAKRLTLPVSGIDCPRRLTNQRDGLKPLLAEIKKSFPQARENLVALSRKSLNDTRIDVTVREGR